MYGVCTTNIDEEVEQRPAISIYPNPARQAFFVEIEQRQAAKIGINVLDVYGRVVWRNAVDRLVSGRQVVKVDLATINASAGVYVVQVIMDGEVVGAERVVLGE